jgi:hypothetical protein
MGLAPSEGNMMKVVPMKKVIKYPVCQECKMRQEALILFRRFERGCVVKYQICLHCLRKAVTTLEKA